MINETPSQLDINYIIKLFSNGKYKEAEKITKRLTKNFPGHSFGWKALAAIYCQTGSISKALIPNQQAVNLSPNDAEAHSNLGNIFKELGRFKEAETSCRKALEIKPNLSEAYNNLGIVLQEFGKLNEATINFRKAIEIKPNFVEAYINLGNSLKDQDKIEDAINEYKKTLQIIPNYNVAFYCIGNALIGVTFRKSMPGLEELIYKILEKKIYVRPKYISSAIISLLKCNPIIVNAFEKYSDGKLIDSINTTIIELSNIPLLLKLMEVSPIPNLEFEFFFRNIRSLILLNISKVKKNSKILSFQIALSLQSFVNEYLYDLTDLENHALIELEKRIENKLKNGQQPCLKELVCIASYKELFQFSWINLLTTTKEIYKLKQMQILEPAEEEKIKKYIPTLLKIKNSVSSKVQKQYEENPYPRWVNLGLSLYLKSMYMITKELKLKIKKSYITELEKPKILIAGCGTGQNSIGTASLFKDCEVLSIDLSLRSLSYAKRKTKELGFTNIKYMQADILDIDLLKVKFDYIESAGVLHHMENPFLGWKKLSQSLKKGGLMRIGLYSQIARRNINKTRDEIAELDTQSKHHVMKNFRSKIIVSNETHNKQHISSLDFYSMSAFRDLLFHSQEHQFTITQIKNYLTKLGLVFCGFDNKKASNKFQLVNSKDDDLYDLEKWNLFEKKNPNTFLGMYQFWCQKI